MQLNVKESRSFISYISYALFIYFSLSIQISYLLNATNLHKIMFVRLLICFCFL